MAIRQLLGNTKGILGVDLGAGRALTRLAAWVSAVTPRVQEDVLEPETRYGRASAISEVMTLGEQLSRDVLGIKGRIFRKSVEEALFEAGGLKDQPNNSDLFDGLYKFRSHHGVKGFIELFLSLYVFNMVWITIQDPVRLRARDARSFETLMADVERFCFRIAKSEIQKSQDAGELDRFGTSLQLSDGLLLAIEDRLSGSPRHTAIGP